MEYKYITEDNLIHKQDYMYSEFGGDAFLNSYISSRDVFINDYQEDICNNRITCRDLCKTLELLQDGDYESARIILDEYVKRFEVSKRLYSKYNEKWKNTDSSSYEEWDIYLALSECCLSAYRLSKCTKYYSCLLKLDDTLLSVTDRMTQVQCERLRAILIQERKIFDVLCSSLGVWK